jgi:hypothetical protein
MFMWDILLANGLVDHVHLTPQMIPMVGDDIILGKLLENPHKTKQLGSGPPA